MTFYKTEKSRKWYIAFGSPKPRNAPHGRLRKTTGFDIREDAKALHDFVKPIFYAAPERFEECYQTARLLILECRTLGIRFKPDLGLIPNARRIQIRWQEISRLMNEIRERGFGGGRF